MSENNLSMVRIIVDSGSDMLPSEAQRYGITVLPMKVRFGDEEFDDGVTLSRDDFYRRLSAAGTIPKTSQVTPFRYGEAFREAIEKGQEAVCLTLSSGISGSYQSAVLAASEYDDRVHVIDTRQFCGSEYLLALRAAALRDQGLSAGDITGRLEEEKKRVRIIALFDTLEYLKLGGRISGAAAAVGGMLSIKPVLTIENGAVRILEKARGSKKGMQAMIRFVQENGGIDPEMPILFSWSGCSDESMEKFVEASASLYGDRDLSAVPRSRVGATIGTYTGPGAIALSFFTPEIPSE